VAKTFGHSALVAWSLLGLGPFVLICLLSFRTNTGIFSNPLSMHGPFVLNNYAQAWAGPIGYAGMGDYFRNTIMAAVVTLLVTLSAGSTAAFFVSRVSSRAQQRLLRLFLMGSVVPFVLIIIPLYQGYDALHALNHPALLGIAYGSLSLPVTVLILYSFYLDFPADLLEAAEVDGLTEYSTYLRIVLPLSKAPLTAVGLITLVFVWSEAQIGIIILQSAQSQTIAIGVLGFVQTWQAAYGPLFAGLTIATVPIIIVYLVFNRFIRKGLALGGYFR